MPDTNSRSPCRLLESAPPAPQTGTELRETRKPDRAHLNIRQEARGDSTVTLLDVTVATVGKVNRNGRLYRASAWEAAIAAAQEDIASGRLWGLLEHPDDWYDPQKGQLERICVRYESLAIEGDHVKATGVLVETSAGKDLKALVDGGISVGVSTNGTASVQYLPAKELGLDLPDPEQYIAVIQDDFRLATIDMVGDPSDTAGSARKKERQQRRPKENHMNPKLKKMLEALNLDEAAFKAQYPDEHAALTVTPAPTPNETGAVNMEAYRALEQTVVSLRSVVENLTTDNLNSQRDGIVSTALEAAKLPSAGKIKYGETEIDLDASFRAELIQVSRAAESADVARQAVDQKIAERRATIKPGETQKPARNGVSLPVGENSGVKPETASTGTVKSARANLGL